MKRPLLSALIVGLVVVGIVVVLHWVGLLLRPERGITDLLSSQAPVTRTVSNNWQYFFVFILAGGVADDFAPTRRAQLGVIIATYSSSWRSCLGLFALSSSIQPLPSLVEQPSVSSCQLISEFAAFTSGVAIMPRVVPEDRVNPGSHQACGARLDSAVLVK
jgi:hypothetical protein